jgi:hypothetical protein
MLDNKKEGTQDEQATSDENHSSPKIEGADAKNRGSIQDNTSTQDDQSDNTSNKGSFSSLIQLLITLVAFDVSFFNVHLFKIVLPMR